MDGIVQYVRPTEVLEGRSRIRSCNSDIFGLDLFTRQHSLAQETNSQYGSHDAIYNTKLTGSKSQSTEVQKKY